MQFKTQWKSDCAVKCSDVIQILLIDGQKDDVSKGAKEGSLEVDDGSLGFLYVLLTGSINLLMRFKESFQGLVILRGRVYWL